MRLPALLLIACLSAPAFAQSPVSGAPSGAASPGYSPMADVRANWHAMSEYILQSALDAPESVYGYKPTPAVRSFGELIGHVAGAQAMFCALALGEPAPREDAVTAATKTQLVAALRASNSVCDRAYAQADAAGGATLDLFGTRRTRFYTLVENATHDAEHYGNLVTYLRMNGMVPPSSKPAR